MPRSVMEGGWPNERQTLLLTAASWPDERGHEAWEHWRVGFDPEQLSDQDLRLLAAAFRPVNDHDVRDRDPALSLAGAVYRRAWYMNQLAVHRLASVIDALAGAEIPVLVLKGLALARLHYRDLGARPMRDIDLLVGPSHERPAIAVLRDLGYTVLASEGGGNGPLKYGTHLGDGGDGEIDLHAYALIDSADDGDLWEAAVPLSVGRSSALALGPADQLLHVCAHGIRFSAETPVGWIPDAMAVLRSSGGALDWERLVERASARRLTVAVGSALGWLRDALGANIPPEVLGQLHRAPKMRLEAGVHRLARTPPTRAHFVVYSWDRYRRFAQLARPECRPRNFIAYLQDGWELESPARLLEHGGRKLLPRVLRELRLPAR